MRLEQTYRNQFKQNTRFFVTTIMFDTCISLFTLFAHSDCGGSQMNADERRPNNVRNTFLELNRDYIPMRISSTRQTLPSPEKWHGVCLPKMNFPFIST